MALLLAQLLQGATQDLRMANILQLLEVVGSVFYHQLEATRVVFSILCVDEIVDPACDAASLVGRQDQDLGDLGAVSIEARMGLVNSEQRHQLLC